jgi:hypothetical protein
MDSWKPLHLRMMQLGGNQRFIDFLEAHGVPENLPIREKYSTRAAKWYRENLRAEAEGSEPPAPLPSGTGHLPSDESASSMGRVLDQVFAKAPKAASMTSGGVQRAQLLRGKLSRVSSKGLWCRLGASMRPSSSAPAALCRTTRSDDTRFGDVMTSKPAAQLTKSSHGGRARTLSPSPQDRNTYLTAELSLEWLRPFMPLPTLLGNTGLQNAERLQTMSSGKMEGFGSDTCLRSQSVVICGTSSVAEGTNTMKPEVHRHEPNVPHRIHMCQA